MMDLDLGQQHFAHLVWDQRGWGSISKFQLFNPGPLSIQSS